MTCFAVFAHIDQPSCTIRNSSLQTFSGISNFSMSVTKGRKSRSRAQTVPPCRSPHSETFEHPRRSTSSVASVPKLQTSSRSKPGCGPARPDHGRRILCLTPKNVHCISTAISDCTAPSCSSRRSAPAPPPSPPPKPMQQVDVVHGRPTCGANQAESAVPLACPHACRIEYEYSSRTPPKHKETTITSEMAGARSSNQRFRKREGTGCPHGRARSQTNVQLRSRHNTPRRKVLQVAFRLPRAGIQPHKSENSPLGLLNSPETVFGCESPARRSAAAPRRTWRQFPGDLLQRSRQPASTRTFDSMRVTPLLGSQMLLCSAR